MKKIFSSQGQAMVEYLLIFSVMAMISINLLKSFSGYFDSSIGVIGQAFNQQLSVGVCERNCFFKGFTNQ